MKKLKKILTSRVPLTALLILVQLIWLLVSWQQLSQYAGWIGAAFTVLSLLMVLYLVRGDENPAYRIIWIVLIMATPVLGGLIYLLFGGRRPSRGMRAKLDAGQKKIAPGRPDDTAARESLKADHPRMYGQSNYVRRLGYPVYNNTTTQIYTDGQDLHADLLEALEKAEHFIFLEYFTIQPGAMWDPMLEILKRKAAAGLDVRVIYDDFGSLITLPKNYAKTLEEYGIRCMAFNPFRPLLSIVMNNRDHRKITVVDGYIAFNGGVNLSDEYINVEQPYGYWKDGGIRVEGEAVWNFTAMFLEMWQAFRPEELTLADYAPHRHHPAPFASDGWVQPFSDTPLDGEPVSENVYIDILAQAKDYVYIYTPYLIIDDIMKEALRAAARRGVDVRIVTPGIPDKKIVYRLTRSHYPPLLKAGVRIYEYTPGFLHTKNYVSDDVIGLVGTINMDYRSLYLHFECGTCLYDTSSVAKLKADALATFALSREIPPTGLRSGLLANFIDSVLRLLAPLF